MYLRLKFYTQNKLASYTQINLIVKNQLFNFLYDILN